MKFIAHRGNIDGKNPNLENHPDYIQSALDAGFDCEVDVWFNENTFFLGHDRPVHPVDIEFLKKPGIWCHCKNIEALERLLDNNVHCFWHENDNHTLTSQNYIWTYPNKPTTHKSIIVSETLPKKNCYGVCSDYVKALKENYHQREKK